MNTNSLHNKNLNPIKQINTDNEIRCNNPYNNITFYKEGQEVDDIPSLSEILKTHCKRIHNVLSPELLIELNDLSRNTIRTYGNDTSDMIIRICNLNLHFSSNYTLLQIPQEISKFNSKSTLIAKIIQFFAERLAKELKKTGLQTIDFQIFRYTPLSGSNLNQLWHYDQKSSHSMVLEVYNDFTPLNGLGLNIAFNSLQGPFNPSQHFEELQLLPKDNQYASLKYIPNGALIFESQQGNIIHRMSTLAAKNFEPHKSQSRVIVQIKLQDTTWK